MAPLRGWHPRFLRRARERPHSQSSVLNPQSSALASRLQYETLHPENRGKSVYVVRQDDRFWGQCDQLSTFISMLLDERDRINSTPSPLWSALEKTMKTSTRFLTI